MFLGNVISFIFHEETATLKNHSPFEGLSPEWKKSAARLHENFEMEMLYY
jgi:hypothetical protein